jgi:hypothetical protein
MALQIVRNKQVRKTKGTYLSQKSVAKIFKLLDALLLPFFFAHHTQGDQKKLPGYFQQKRLLPFYFTKLLKEAIYKLLREATPSF